jgi:hypothetical protein
VLNRIFGNIFKDFLNSYAPKEINIVIDKDKISLSEFPKFQGYYIITNLICKYLPFSINKCELFDIINLSKISDYLTSLEVLKLLSQKFNYTKINIGDQFEYS